LGCPEFGFFGFAARFEDFVEYLNFPSQGIPFELLDDILAGLNGQISEQLPLDFFLFSDRRQDSYLAKSDFKNGFVRGSIAISNLDAMQSFDGGLIHFLGDRVISVSSQAVDTSPNQEMCPDLLCCAEKLVNVALAIADMETPSRIR
jgi:hypothetical protein